jgi:hypothetical protein
MFPSTPARPRRRGLLRGLMLLAGSAVVALASLAAASPARADANVQIIGPASPVTVNTPYTYNVTTFGNVFSGFYTATVSLSGAPAAFTGYSSTGAEVCTLSGAQASCQSGPGGNGTISLTVLPTAAGTVTASVSETSNYGDGSDSTTTTITNSTFPFTGFFAPVDNPPAVNMVHAGQAIPIQFSLGSDQGLNILAPGYPTVQQVDCTSGAPVNTATETDTAGGSGLQDNGNGNYTYVWKTSKASSGTCQTFTLGLTDGTFHTASFQYAS